MDNFMKVADSALNERERTILALRLQGLTLEQVGACMGITRETVRQAQAKASARLYRHYLAYIRPIVRKQVVRDYKSALGVTLSPPPRERLDE